MASAITNAVRSVNKRILIPRATQQFASNFTAAVSEIPETAFETKTSFEFENDTYISLLHRSPDASSLKQIHARLLAHGFQHDIRLATKLIALYAKFRRVSDSRYVFNQIPEPDSFLCNMMIRVCVNNGGFQEALNVYNLMQRRSLKADSYTYPFALKACAAMVDLSKGIELHARILVSGFVSDVFVGNSIIDMYSKCRNLDSARQMFEEMPVKDSVSWGIIITGFVQNGNLDEGFGFLEEMQRHNLWPDQNTVAALLSGCARAGDLQRGEWIHENFVGYDCIENVFVGSALVDMYAKCGSVEYARLVFERILDRDRVLWNAMIGGYAHNGYAEDCLVLFDRMKRTPVKPDAVTVVSALSACKELGALQRGRRIHDYVRRNGLDSNVLVVNSLIAMYGKCGEVDFAKRTLFDKMPKRIVGSWNSLMAGYVHAGCFIQALELLESMESQGFEPDSATFKTVLSACGNLGVLEHGRKIHQRIVDRGMESDVSVASALVDMYGKCSSVEMARGVFDSMPVKNVISWTAMIAAYGSNGQGNEAMDIFHEMLQTQTEPNDVTFLAVLSACNYSGLVKEGFRYFDSMRAQFGIPPAPKHFASIVDLLGRAGRLDEAHTFIVNMPIPADASVWKAFLGACRIHGDSKLAEYAANSLAQLQLNESAKGQTKRLEFRTLPTCTVIEVSDEIHSFTAGDCQHPETDRIRAKVEELIAEMEKSGYLPGVALNLHDAEEAEKHLLWSHSEKFAVAFAFLSAGQEFPIRITSNSRPCEDCHEFLKIVSKVKQRSIVMRDLKRSHYFKGGVCSCGDYW